MEIQILIGFIIIVTIILSTYKNKKLTNEENQKYKQITDVEKTHSFYASKYEKKQLLTKTEQYFYNEIEPICEEKNIKICPKVRIEDFVKIKAKGKEYNYYRNMIKARHIDFLLTDKQLNIIAAIELDDYTHNYDKNVKTDQFKNSLYFSIGINLHRIKVGSNYREQIENILNFYNYEI